jgi:[protein-PII] uridylyltransferase
VERRREPSRRKRHGGRTTPRIPVRTSADPRERAWSRAERPRDDVLRDIFVSAILQPTQTIKADVAQCLRVAQERHRRGEDALRVAQGLSDGIDGIVRQLYSRVLEEEEGRVALLAVGGYGRRELCPFSDIDLLFIWSQNRPRERIEQLIRLFWDSGFQLGHSVRTPAECYQFMVDDSVTAAALLEHRYLAGGDGLYRQFRDGASVRYRKKSGEAFVRERLEQLRQSLYGPDRTIYALQPHLKDGCCGLRDVQRVLWIENIRSGAGTFDGLARSGSFDPDEIARLRAAYTFFVRVRTELHFSNGVKQDILARDSLPDVARNLGYRGDPQLAAEKFLGEYFHHARVVSRFLRHYVETGTRGRRFFAKLGHKLFRNERLPKLVEENGLLFPVSTAFGAENFEESVLDAYLLAQRERLKVSESFTRLVRQRLAANEDIFTNQAFINTCFVEILHGDDVGRTLKAMHRAGVLARVLPEFRQLDGLVTFDGHHQFTVDEHTLRALELLDRIAAGADDAPEKFRRIASSIRDLFPLRLALLLHDVGKGVPAGDHSVTGGETAILVCERLGLDERITELVEFLIYRHLAMFRVSESRDYTETNVIDSFATLVQTSERLDMLYLLTFIDISSVGPGTWTSWKGAQLDDVYERARAYLLSRRIDEPDLEQNLIASRVPAAERAEIIDHCTKIGHPSYVRDILPERMAVHVGMVRELLATGRSQVSYENCGDYLEIAFSGHDRPRLFSDYSGLLFSEGFNVLGARIFSRSDGIAIDVFFVEIADGINVDIGQRVGRIRTKLGRLDAKEIVIEDVIREWVRSYRYRKLRRKSTGMFPASVKFDNDSSPRSTLIEVIAGDRPGLLYDLSSALSRLALDVRTAKVSTMSDRCRDVFYVVEADGEKVTNPARLKEIETTLITEVQDPKSVLVP